MMYLILQGIRFQAQMLKPCESIQKTSEKVLDFKTRQLVSIELEELFQPLGLTASRQIGICRGL